MLFHGRQQPLDLGLIAATFFQPLAGQLLLLLQKCGLTALFITGTAAHHCQAEG
jgi:nicotinamidase-related amidase